MRQSSRVDTATAAGDGVDGGAGPAAASILRGIEGAAGRVPARDHQPCPRLDRPRQPAVSGSSLLAERHVALGSSSHQKRQTGTLSAQTRVEAQRRWPLEELLAALQQRFPRRRERSVFIEYVMLRDVNDSLEDAHRLAALLEPVECKVNLIVFNPHLGTRFLPSQPEQVLAFRQASPEPASPLVRNAICFVTTVLQSPMWVYGAFQRAQRSASSGGDISGVFAAGRC